MGIGVIYRIDIITVFIFSSESNESSGHYWLVFVTLPLVHHIDAGGVLPKIQRSVIAMAFICISAIAERCDCRSFLKRGSFDNLTLPPCRGYRRTGLDLNQCNALMRPDKFDPVQVFHF